MIINSILLCTYNEGKFIKNTIIELDKHIKDLEIIVVDDASTDNTISDLENLKSKINIKIIKRQNTKGLGSAFQRALIESSGDHIGWIDSNMSEVAAYFPDMISELKNHDLILLSRYIDGGSDDRIFIRVWGSKLINFICRLYLGNKIKDYTSSIFIMKRTVLNEATILGYGHGDFFVEFLHNVIKKKLSIKEIPYKQKKDDEEGNTTTSPNLIRFFMLGFFYFIRVLLIKFRRN
jgi:glycosyltransferase involved in cell wall biosynthesis